MKLSKIISLMIMLLILAGTSYAQKESWERLNNKANNLYLQARYSEAIKIGKEALRVAEKTFGPDHQNVGSTLNNLAASYRAGRPFFYPSAANCKPRIANGQ